MSALPHAARHSLEPPIASSSVPRCPCQRDQPCPCERYSARLERSQREFEARAIEVSKTLTALAEVAVGDTLKRALRKAAEDLF